MMKAEGLDEKNITLIALKGSQRANGRGLRSI